MEIYIYIYIYIYVYSIYIYIYIYTYICTYIHCMRACMRIYVCVCVCVCVCMYKKHIFRVLTRVVLDLRPVIILLLTLFEALAGVLQCCGGGGPAAITAGGLGELPDLDPECQGETANTSFSCGRRRSRDPLRKVASCRGHTASWCPSSFRSYSRPCNVSACVWRHQWAQVRASCNVAGVLQGHAGAGEA